MVAIDELLAVVAGTFSETSQKVGNEKRLSKVYDVFSYLCENTDFLKAPASTKYHGSYEGGLFEHSVNVMKRMIKLAELFAPKVDPVSVITVSLFHDICKTNVYIPTTVSKNIEGRWVDCPGYSFQDNFPLGHGSKSVFLLKERYPELSQNEALAIHWHMGAFTNTDRMWEMEQVWLKQGKDNPLIFLLHLADQLASLVDEAGWDLNDNSEDMEIPTPAETAAGTYLERFYTLLPRTPQTEWLGKYLQGDLIVGDNRPCNFMSSPASKTFFAEEGGLVEWANRFFDAMFAIRKLTELPIPRTSLAKVGLLAPIGRTNTFYIEMKNRKEGSSWVKYPYVYTDEEIPYGSLGGKAVYVTQTSLRYERDEALAVRFYEGQFDWAWRPSTNGRSDPFQEATSKYPLVTVAYLAYLLASYSFDSWKS